MSRSRAPAGSFCVLDYGSGVPWVVFALAGGFLAASIALTLLWARRILRAVNALTVAAKRIARDDLKHRVFIKCSSVSASALSQAAARSWPVARIDNASPSSTSDEGAVLGLFSRDFNTHDVRASAGEITRLL